MKSIRGGLADKGKQCDELCKQFSRDMERAFWDRFEKAQEICVPDQYKDRAWDDLNLEERTEVMRHLREVANMFSDMLLATTVNTLGRIGDLSEEAEDLVVQGVREWFRTLRERRFTDGKSNS